jgi:hypothetical protein
VSIEVIGPDKQRVSTADVSSLPAAQIKKADGTWELEVPPQVRPADGTFVLSASLKEAFLAGSTKVVLADDYFPCNNPTCDSPFSPRSRNGHRRPGKAGCRRENVAIEGYTEIAKTNEMGNFEVPSHHASGQQISVVAKKNGKTAKKTGQQAMGLNWF